MNVQTLFTYDADAPILTAEEEAVTIVAAQAGNPESYDLLLRAYGPALRAAVGRAKKTIDTEEAQATALLAFAEVLASHDVADPAYADGRLASRIVPALKDSLGEAQAQAAAGFEVPKRTYVRFLGILNEAEGDLNTARALAPSRKMTVETFDAVVSAIGTTTLDDGSEGATGGGNPQRDRIESAQPIYSATPISDAEDALLVEVAFSAVDDDEARIVELAYGFTDYDPVPDAEIGHRLGLTRPTVQRKRGKALGKMRESIGVTLATA